MVPSMIYWIFLVHHSCDFLHLLSKKIKHMQENVEDMWMTTKLVVMHAMIMAAKIIRQFIECGKYIG